MTSATEETWWPRFLEEYGKTPLRELARRFGTNSRRLRRAAQRSGLSDEPQALRDGVELLGRAPDASVAEKLGVTAEAVKGARVRRRLPPFRPNAPQEPLRKPAPEVKTEVKTEVPVVVRRVPTVTRAERPPPSYRKVAVPGPEVVERKRRPMSSSWDEELPPAGRDVRGQGKRLRMVPRPEREPVEAPTQEAPRRRRQSRKDYAPVKTLFDRKDDDDVPPALASLALPLLRPAPVKPPPIEPPPIEPPLVTPPPVKPPPVRAARVKPVPKPVEASPVPAEAPTSSQAEAPAEQARYWSATVEGSVHVISAPSLDEAARLAAAQGSVSSLAPLDVL